MSSEAQDTQDRTDLQRVVLQLERRVAQLENRQLLHFDQMNASLNHLAEMLSGIASGRTHILADVDLARSDSSRQTLLGTLVPISMAQQSSSVSSTNNVNNNDSSTSSNNSSNPIIRDRRGKVVEGGFRYQLSRNVRTVTDLYKEWFEGLDGNHSVQYFEINHPECLGREKSFFSKRKNIIKACSEHALAKSISVEAAAKEAERIRKKWGRNIDYLGRNPGKIFYDKE